MVLVTGGTGLVGSHLLLHLLRQGVSVRAIHRASSNLNRVNKVFRYYETEKEAKALFQSIEWTPADILDIPALDIAFQGVKQVYHCAAYISFDPADYTQLKRINLVGTTNIVNLCLAHGVQKLAYVSSVAALGKGNRNQPITEDTEWDPNTANVYALSKYRAEMEVWRGSQEGLDVIVLNPGVIIGPGFWSSGSGKFFTTAASKPYYYPPNGTGFVAVKDVVQALVGLMESNITQERFVLVGENLKYYTVLKEIAATLGYHPPKKALAPWQLETLWRLDWLWSKFHKNGRKLSKQTAQGLQYWQPYSAEKIRQTLGFQFSPIKDTLQETAEIFKRERS